MFQIGAYDKWCNWIGYFVPKHKNAIAKSTIATKDALLLAHVENPKATFTDLLKIIKSWRCYSEGEAVIEAHIKAGYGNCIPDW